MGMEPEGIRRKTNLQMEEGRYLNDDDRLSLIISKKFAARLKVTVGDKIAIVVNMAEGGTNAKDFSIKGIFSVKTGLQFADELIYISLWDAQDLMGLNSNQVFSLGIYLKDVDAVDKFEIRIREKLAKENLSCRINSWKKVMEGILAQYYFIKHIVLAFTIILLLIVCVGVINAIFLSVSERTREIGTIKAIGAKRKTIIFLFMLEGAILSLVSTSCGSLLGVSISILFEKIGLEASTEGAAWLFSGKSLYPYLTYSSVIFAFFFVIAVTLIAISYPIIKASKLEPTEALGYV
jgi:putative ABC transport system permease protein